MVVINFFDYSSLVPVPSLPCRSYKNHRSQLPAIMQSINKKPRMGAKRVGATATGDLEKITFPLWASIG